MDARTPPMFILCRTTDKKWHFLFGRRTAISLKSVNSEGSRNTFWNKFCYYYKRTLYKIEPKNYLSDRYILKS